MPDKPTYEELEQRVRDLEKDAYEQQRYDKTIERSNESFSQQFAKEDIDFKDLFNLEDIQKLQDTFAKGTRVASIITNPDGTPITKPSNFCRLCEKIIRKTDKGLKNCFHSDAVIGRQNQDGPSIQPCLSGGLWDAGSSITVGGKHIANWLIGQVRNETQDEKRIIEYAIEIGADVEDFRHAFREVPTMSMEQFSNIANTLFIMANQLSSTAYNNLLQRRFIKARKQAEEALRESEGFNSNLLENSPTPVLVVNPDMSIRYVSPALEKLTGYSMEELRGLKAPYPWWTDDPRSGNLKERKNSVADGVRGHEKLFQSKDGEDFWVEIDTIPILQDGDLKYTLTHWTDITERKQTEEDLRDSKEKYRVLFEHAGVGITLFDPEAGNRLAFNRMAHESLGYTHEEFQNLTTLDFDVGTNQETFTKRIKKVREKGIISFEAKHRTKEGEIRHRLITNVRIDVDGRECIQGIWLDITDLKQAGEDRKRLEAQLQQAQKMESIGTLAGGIAHDFNNVLMPIMVHSEMAMMDLTSDNPLQHNLNEIFKAGERARDLVKQILTFSRKSEGEQIAIKIIPILNEVLKMLRSSIPTTIEIRQSFDAKSCITLADPTQIHQIILNLGTNAAHAMRERGGILEVCLIHEDLDKEAAAHYTDLTPGSYMKLTVSDTGSGIDDETMQKIFEPYFTTKQVGEGTGMGLALVHGIVKGYGGDITVESELGKGTTFNVYLPRIEGEVTSVGKDSVQLPRGSEKVLLVDDEKSMLDAIQPMLENLGYKVTSRTSSIEALEAFKNNPNGFDLVITDMAMPNMTGKELAMEILSIRSGMPIILCTGYSEQIKKDEAEAMGISAYLMKPIVMHDMAKTIREVLDNDKE